MIAGCDGFHGICRPLIPGHLGVGADLSVRLAGHPGRRGARHRRADLLPPPDGFALYSMRSPAVSRLYLQVPPEEPLDELAR